MQFAALMLTVGIVVAAGGARAQAGAAVLDSATFDLTEVTPASSDTTCAAWAPDDSGRLFLCRKGGVVDVLQNGTLAATPFYTFSPVFTGSECGLLGIAFDPAYSTNKYVYFFVTVSSSEQQIIRLTDTNGTGGAPLQILTGLPTVGANHDGGALGFGPDGKLYFAIGDLGNGTGVDSDLTSLASKVGRANPDGSVPADNPFNDGAGPNNDYIFARGFRNPFTLAFQPGTGKLWINCVGTSYEQVFAVGSGEHAGWNDFENNQPAGFLTPLIKYRTNSTDTRTVTAAVRAAGVLTVTTSAVHRFRVGEKITLSGIGDATMNGDVFVASVPTSTTFTASQSGADASSSGGSAVTQALGGCITGGAFYTGSTFPDGYSGNFFFGDFNSGRIVRAVLDGSGSTVQSVDTFATGVSQAIDVLSGPDNNLYLVKYDGAVLRVSPKVPVVNLQLSGTSLQLNEGGTNTFTVRLSAAPAAPVSVSVSVAVTSGDADVTVQSGAQLNFDANTFATPQTVTVAAAEDDDFAADLATLTVSAPNLTSRTLTVAVVDNDSSGGGGETDSDGDGVSDANELADGTNPLDAGSFNTLDLQVLKLSGGLKFGLTAKDKVQLQAVLPAQPAGLVFAGKALTLNIAGASEAFTLSEKLLAKKENKAQLMLKPKLTRDTVTKQKLFGGGTVPLQAKLPGTWSDDWLDEGAVAGQTEKKLLSFRAELFFNGRRYAATVPVEYKSSDKSGAFKKPRN